MIICPVCDAEIEIDEEELEEGDTFPCEECGAELRVTNVDPLEVERADYEDEDEVYYEDEDEW